MTMTKTQEGKNNDEICYSCIDNSVEKLDESTNTRNKEDENKLNQCSFIFNDNQDNFKC
jgi:hypothetical protein